MTADKAWAAVPKSRQWHDSPTGTEDAANAYPQASRAITSPFGGRASRFGIAAINGKGAGLLLVGSMPRGSNDARSSCALQ